MTHVVVFHHARGLTPGVRAFAEVIHGLGHDVDVPDLYDGRVFNTLADGVAHAEELGFENLAEKGAAAAPDVEGLVVIGFSLGALPAQRLAQTRPGVRAAVLFHSAIPLGVFGDEWPDAVALRVHLCDEDPWAEEDRDAAVDLVDSAADGELILHHGSGHLVCDSTDADHDPVVAAAMLDQTLRLLDEVDTSGRRDEPGRP